MHKLAKAAALAVILASTSVKAAAFDPPGTTCQWLHYPTLQYPYQGICSGMMFIYDGVSTYPAGYYTVTAIPYGDATTSPGNVDPNPFPCRLYEPCSGNQQPSCGWHVDHLTGRMAYTCS